ncbi:MAG: molybdopterin-dependent oxidoreductase, partial [Mesorhizobium sp.]|nr:molybdopterin-dependent oxidoreductase [Mesorhizobium sp.]
MNPRLPLTSFEVNGSSVALPVSPVRRLSSVLRDDLHLTGVKVGCDAGDCGACTVLVDGEPVCACLMPVASANGTRITTIEGLGNGRLSALQASFLEHGAAQCGICTPALLVAASALLERNAEPDEAEVQDALGGILCRCTGYRKIITAVMAASRKHPATEIDFRLPEAGCAIGASPVRLDGIAKVTGDEKYGADSFPEDALAVLAVRSPNYHAKFSIGDIDAWKKMNPGIVAVFTAADIPGINRFGVIPPFADQPALAEREVRFRGEAVAVIAGERDAIANLDLASFPLSWIELPHVLQPGQACAEGAQLVHESRAGNILTKGFVEQGDPEAALSSAAIIVSGEIETSYVEHAYIEPEGGYAYLDGETLVIVACTQAPYMDRDDTAKVLALAPENVRIVPTATGGGFGSKLDVSLQPLIGLVALKTGRPAAMAYSRNESMMSTTKRHPAFMKASIGTDANGRVCGMVFDG